MNKNDIYQLTISGCTHDGYGVARLDGMAVFVPGGAVGDVADVRIVKRLSNRAIGKIERLIVPSPDRIENNCPAFPSCGGCNYRHISYEAESRLKCAQIKAAFERIGGGACPEIDYFPALSIEGYRNKAVFPVVTGADGRTVFGFYRANSHSVVPCPGCRIHASVFSALAAAVCSFMDDFGVPAYDETAKQGVVRSVFIRRGEVTGEIMVCLNAAKRRIQHVDELILYLKAASGQLASVLLSYQPEISNKVVGDRIFTLWGAPYISDVLCGNRLSLSPHTFYQVNHAQCERLYEQVLSYAASCGPLARLNVLDLFCGAGSITLALARRCKAAVGIETVPAAVRDACENAARNGIENVRFICADAQDAASVLAEIHFQPDLVVVDPPRKGLSEAVCRYLSALEIDQIVYVSCDPATLARDVGRLRENGFCPVSISGFDLFPRTANVETVCRLVRRNGLHINIDVDVEEMLQEKRGQATYSQIKEYVLEQTGMKVSSLYISQVKRKCGLDVGKNYNKPKSEDSHVPQCSPEKEEAIKEALKHFGMI